MADFLKTATTETRAMVAGVTVLHEADLKITTRPLLFEEEKHKILNSELKHLYTAITRARANVWFYDEDEEARRPMFEFFQNLQLVTTSAGYARVAAKKSTLDEWSEQGNTLYKAKHWQAAYKSFVNAGEYMMADKCNAQMQFAKLNAGSSVTELLKVAKLCLDCNMAAEAAIALENAGEFGLLEKLRKKIAVKDQNSSV